RRPAPTMNGGIAPGSVLSPEQPNSSAKGTSRRIVRQPDVAGRCFVPKPLRLLLVEDDEGDAALLLWDLRRGGFEPTVERVQALDELRRVLPAQRWDLVICDFYLPTCTGLDALAVVRQSGLDIPFLLVSGTVGEEIAIAAMK